MTRAPAAGLLLLLLAMPIGGHAQSDQETRPLEPFSRLRVQNGIDVILTQSDRQMLRIEVDGVDLDDVIAEVVGDELRLSRRGVGNFGFLSGGRISAYVDFVQLSDIEVSGGSDVEGRSTIEVEQLRVAGSGGSDVRFAVDVPQLEFELSGGSDLSVEGSTERLLVEASGGSDVSARGLQARQVTVRLSGGSDAAVHAQERIDIEASGGSDVSVYGNPSERTTDTDRSSDVTWR